MNINELKTSLSQGNLENLYLFYGEEDYLIRLYISRIKDEIISNPALEDLNYIVFESFDQTRFEESVNTLPAFSDKKLIIFDETGVFKEPLKADKEFLEEALFNIPDYVTVIFREKAIDSRLKKLTGAVEKNGASVKFDYMTEAQLKTWITSIANKNGKKITAQVIEYFLSCTGNSMSVIENELSKLCSFTENIEITKENIDKIVTKSLENRIFELNECIIKKNPKKAMEILNELKLLKEEPIRISALISKNLCDLYKLKTALPENRTPQKLGMHPYVIKINSSYRVSKETLSNLIDLLIKTDEKLKSTSADSWVVLEMFFAQSTTM